MRKTLAALAKGPFGSAIQGGSHCLQFNNNVCDYDCLNFNEYHKSIQKTLSCDSCLFASTKRKHMAVAFVKKAWAVKLGERAGAPKVLRPRWELG